MDTTGAAAFFSLLYGEDRDAILGASASAIYHSGEVTDSVQICLVSAIGVMQHTHESTPWSVWVQGTSKRGKHIFPMSSSSWHSAQARDSVGSLKAAWAGCAETHFALPTSYRCMVSCAQHRQLL